MRYSNEVKTFLDGLYYGLSPQIICEKRTIYCLNWYAKKAIHYRFLFFLLSIMNIAAPLISGLLLTYLNKGFISTILSALTSLSASLLALFNVRDKWTSYRSAAEYIKQQYTLYIIKAAPYHTSECHSIYLSTIEDYMANVHSHWYRVQTTELSKDTTPPCV